jgi:hypothetical protein
MDTITPAPAIRTKDFGPYRDAGYTLFPLRRWNAKGGGKLPRDKGWREKAYDSAAAVIRAAAAEGRNVGVRLAADQMVIDVDPRSGGEEGFARLCADLHLDSPQWPCVITGSGGRHYYLRKPSDVPIRAKLAGYPGVDIKTLGGYVVAAGSVHPNGNPYTWDALASVSLADAPQCPPALLAALRRPKGTGEPVGAGQYTAVEIGRALAALDPTDFREHDKWLRLMMACHHASNGDARAEFIEWSTSDPEYSHDGDKIGRRWDSLRANMGDGVTHRTLLHILAEHGVAGALAAPVEDDDFAEPIADHAEIVKAESRGLVVSGRSNVAADTITNALAAVSKSGLDPAWDELRQNVVFRVGDLPWPESYGRILTDHTLRLMRHYFINRWQGVAYEPGREHLLEAVMTLAYEAKFNPVLEYLAGLTWDGTARIERLFADYIPCGDDAYTHAVARCFMIGAVRRQRQPGCKFDTMPVIQGPQGWLKSTALQTLFGADWFSDADLGSLRDKDAAMKLRGIWVQEFAEIDSLTRAETGALKAFLSRATDRQRDPYGRVVEDAPRRCVFCGTVNEGGYLKDATGGRRFWPLELRVPIDVSVIARDRDQLWAEAATLEAKGESDVLPVALWGIAAERQRDQTSDDPWVDVLGHYLEQRAWQYATHDPLKDDIAPLPPDRVHTDELFYVLGITAAADRSRDKEQRLRTAMEAGLGW